MAEVNIPDAAVDVGWHEFCYPRPATWVPSEAFKRGVQAAAPLIVAAELDLILADRERLPYEQWAQMVADRASKRLVELRRDA